MEPVRRVEGRIVALPNNDIDTDQIIPARFLKVTDKAGLGKACFSDWRYEGDGSPRADFVLNQPQYAGASILIAGHNFGCGSSREHAPWALMGAGFRAIVSTYFADIFSNNALKNGLIPVQVDADTQRQLVSLAQEDPTTAIAIDVESQTLHLPDGRLVPFPLDAFSRYCLLNGVDQLGYLQEAGAMTVSYEQSNPARISTAALLGQG
jgi:3-isopropylmalate/(R)-2-methylmalate dehydratase small subunit